MSEPTRWRLCVDCGRRWPYPVGGQEATEYRCEVCVEAHAAERIRLAGADVAALTAQLAEAQRERDDLLAENENVAAAMNDALRGEARAQAEVTALREALAKATFAVHYYTGEDIDALLLRLEEEGVSGGQPPTGGQ